MDHTHHSEPGSGGFLDSLLQTYVPRRQCMFYEADVIWTHFVSDLLIAGAYYSIPLGLIYFVRRRSDLAYNWIFVLFASFILLCGTTHIFSVIALWQPYYRLEGIVKLMTGVVSIGTAVLLWRLIPSALALPGLQEITRRRDELEALVEERTARLTEANEALREADARKDEFLAMLAHELRNPLASVSNAIQLLKMPNTPPQYTEWSKEILERQFKHMARMIDDLLDVSRITRGKIGLKKERVDAARIARDAADSIDPQANQKGQRIALDISDRALWCDADPTRLEQILTNLLTNAVRYTQEGGHIALSAAEENGRIVLRVQDDGPGIPRAKLNEIFELFAQGDRSLARSEGGLGIGLTLVRRLAELHGGTAYAFSEGEGKGSVFTVELPLAEAHAQGAVSGGEAIPSLGERQSRRILIVDDNADMASGLAKILELDGHDARVTFDGVSALAVAHEFMPEIILLDIGLPGMDGYEVARKLRENGLKDTVLIAVTGYGKEEDLRNSRDAGFDAHLVKPVEHARLIALIEENSRS